MRGTCFAGRGVLAIVQVIGDWQPTSWQDRPNSFQVLELIGESYGRKAREFCLGHNHQALQVKSRCWAMVVPA